MNCLQKLHSKIIYKNLFPRQHFFSLSPFLSLREPRVHCNSTASLIIIILDNTTQSINIPHYLYLYIKHLQMLFFGFYFLGIQSRHKAVQGYRQKIKPLLCPLVVICPFGTSVKVSSGKPEAIRLKFKPKFHRGTLSSYSARKRGNDLHPGPFSRTTTGNKRL